MVIVFALCAAGWLCGLLLLRTVPSAAHGEHLPAELPAVSIIIPARNEEANLPKLLGSLAGAHPAPCEILVVNDGSTDNTARVAEAHGARVLASAGLPAGWTGKTWACYQGAQAARGTVLFFLDADVSLLPGGYARLLARYAQLGPRAALSVLPYHATQAAYEQLSLFFNILMAMGAGGFGGLDAPHLFGQSLLVDAGLYWQVDGHGAVRREVLENLHLAPVLRAAGGRLATLGGRGTLAMRMFPHGLGQLCGSWRKAFANGAGATSGLVLGLSIGWLTAAMLTFTMLLVTPGPARSSFACLYLLFALQLAWYARQLGAFRVLAAMFYPLPLVFYFTIFGQSALARAQHTPVTWRGRAL